MRYLGDYDRVYLTNRVCRAESVDYEPLRGQRWYRVWLPEFGQSDLLPFFNDAEAVKYSHTWWPKGRRR